MTLIEITDGRERAAVLVEMHKRWTPTMEVSVWGRGKATRTDKNACRLPDAGHGAQYRGDCDNCDFFMGAKVKAPAYWGECFPACCALDLEAKDAEPKA